MITLFGATGYTGQLIARALDREGLPYRLAGRSNDRLAALSAALPARPGWLVADAAQPGTLPPLFHGSRCLVNCAGPYTDLGERVVAQAAMSGTHYLDLSNELGFLFRIRGYHEMARRTGAALVPACGFDVALADCAAHLLGERLLEGRSHEIDEFHVVYDVKQAHSSRGTRRSAVRTLATSWIAYRDGEWTGQMPGGRVRKFPLPAGDRYALLIPSGESLTLPAHLPVRRVDAWMTGAAGTRFWAPVLVPLLARLSRSILRPLILSLAARGGLAPSGEPPAGGLRQDAPFTIYLQARSGSVTRWMALTGSDPYGLTAEIVAYAARRFTADDYAQSGILAPAQAFDPGSLIAHAKTHWGITVLEG